MCKWAQKKLGQANLPASNLKMGFLERFFSKVFQNWYVEYCPDYIFSVIKICIPDPRENISRGDPLLPGLIKRAFLDLGGGGDC